MAQQRLNIHRRSLVLGATVTAGLASASVRAETECTGARIEVYRSGDNWRWRLIAQNGKQIAEHSQPYDSKSKCLKGIRSVTRTIQAAPIIMKDDCE